ncbi:Ger(x)C family spore germination protein [Jeotgalibacillus marinus]|uniref:Ger(X)C family spore germination protein n=1 Tax=Jeotgalibacillus marinus TaxID=86667 RepID=A0ABV3Q4G9_9BACL
MNIIKQLFVFVTAIVFLTGCWDAKELNDIAIIAGIALDEAENGEIMLSIQSMNQKEFAEGESPSNAPGVMYSLQGNSISNLMAKINNIEGRQPIFSHTRIMIISESIAKRGIKEYLDVFERNPEFRNNLIILIAKDSRAKDILTVTSPTHGLATLKLSKQMDMFHKNWSGITNVELIHFIDNLISKGRQPLMGAITLKNKSNIDDSTTNLQNIDLNQNVELVGASIFKDDKYVGDLNLENTRNYSWTQTTFNGTNLEVPCEENKLKEEDYTSIKVLRGKRNINTKIVNDKPIINITISGSGIIQESQCSANLSSQDVQDEITRKSETLVKNSVENTINFIQKEYGLDIFGFGEVVERQNYKEFKKLADNWDEHFKNAEINVDVKMYIHSEGKQVESFITNLDEEDE